MQKQTKDQKHYRKLKEDSQKDFRKVERDNSPYPGIRVTKKQITFRVSQEAADRLKVLADQAKRLSGKWSAESSSKDSQASRMLDGRTTMIYRLVGTSGIGH